MSGLKITYPTGATPIDLDEAHELKLDYISTMAELNQAEQSNISDAFVWAQRQHLDDVLNATFIFKLHERMFKDVWRWAGKMRRSNKSIGVMKENIMNDLGRLIEDTQYWLTKDTYPVDETCVRFHHRLVQIHIFPNGNGRHARLMTDLLVRRCGKPKFSWGLSDGATSLEVEGKTRKEYIRCLQSADKSDFVPLIRFVRS